MKPCTIIDEDWVVVESALPAEWRAIGEKTGATRRHRRYFRSADRLLRILLMHVGKGYSLRETAARAHVAKLGLVSDVAILDRMRMAEGWFREMCLALVKEQRIDLPDSPKGGRLRLVDSTLVKEPGPSGSQWRLHYSLLLPSLECDHFDLTPAKGVDTGESLTRLEVAAGDLVLADRGFSRAADLDHVQKGGGRLLVRLNWASLPLVDQDGHPLALLEKLATLETSADVGEWEAFVPLSGDRRLAVRVCALRKDQAAIALAHKRLRRQASKKQHKVRPETFEHAKYIVVVTTLPVEQSGVDILELYRLRWQIELLFKRLKSLANLGHVPKKDPASSRAWLYGKLLVALLADKLTRQARAFSPWGFDLPRARAARQPLARMGFHRAPAADGPRAAHSLSRDHAPMGLDQGTAVGPAP
jgi:hypothetical protein